MGPYKVCAHYGLVPSMTDEVHLRCYCPFHDDHDPSLSVNVQEGIFHCWACHESGNMLQFVIRMEQQYGKKIDEWDAILLTAQIEQNTSEEPVYPERIQPIRSRLSGEEAKEFAFQFFQSFNEPIWEKLQNHSFIKRGLTPKFLRKFQVRYNPTSLHPTIIPVYQNHEFQGFVMRRESDMVDPKYLNNEGFDRRSVVAAELSGKADIFLVEGMVDYLKVRQYGYQDAACIFGSHISENQFHFLRKYARSIIDASDNDEAGLKFSKQIHELFYDRPIYKFPLRRFNDPGEMTENHFLGSFACIKRSN